jgi:hypothetical protein
VLTALRDAARMAAGIDVQSTEPGTPALDDVETMTPSQALAYQALVTSKALGVAVDLHRYPDGEVTTFLGDALPKKWAIWLENYGSEQTTEVVDIGDSDYRTIRRALRRARPSEDLAVINGIGRVEFFGVDATARFRLLARRST